MIDLCRLPSKDHLNSSSRHNFRRSPFNTGIDVNFGDRIQHLLIREKPPMEVVSHGRLLVTAGEQAWFNVKHLSKRLRSLVRSLVSWMSLTV